MAAGCWLRLPRLLLLLAAVLRPRSEEGASVAAAKELMRARCSACEAVAWELESWLRPPTKAEASAREAEEQRLRKVASDASLGTSTDGTGSGVARLERIPHTWRPLPLAIGELRTAELLEGLCGKMESYELIGRDTLDTDREDVHAMIWVRADPNNMAHRVNPRVGLERAEIKAYCDDLLAEVEEALTARLEAGRPAETEARDAVAAEIHSSLDWLCRQQTQECVGDAKERLRQRHAAAYAQRKRGAQSAAGLATSGKNGADLSWAAAKEEEQRVTSTKQKRQQPPHRLSWGERQRGGGHWQPLGDGCCGNTHAAIQNGSTLFSGQMGSEAQCRRACADTERCRYAVRGWEHAPGWCVLLARCELPLDASPTGCGSSGANGVASWELHRQEPGAARTKKTRKKKRKQKKKKTTTST